MKRRSSRQNKAGAKKNKNVPSFANPFGREALAFARQNNAITRREAKAKYKEVNWKGYWNGKVVELVNGDVYDGEFDNDGWFSGIGIFLNNVGNNIGKVYEGEFNAGLCDGNGKTHWLSTCDVWQNNHCSQGFKRKPYKNKPFIYRGEFKRDKKHGIGVVTFKDGIRFRGKWEKDKAVKFHEHQREGVDGEEKEEKEEDQVGVVPDILIAIAPQVPQIVAAVVVVPPTPPQAPARQHRRSSSSSSSSSSSDNSKQQQKKKVAAPPAKKKRKSSNKSSSNNKSSSSSSSSNKNSSNSRGNEQHQQQQLATNDVVAKKMKQLYDMKKLGIFDDNLPLFQKKQNEIMKAFK